MAAGGIASSRQVGGRDWRSREQTPLDWGEGEGQKGKKTTSVRLAIRTRSRKPLFLSKATEARIAGK
jgi:hypothetical protein